MEAAGLAIGAIALVSLFKDCIDLFSMISAAQELNEYATTLNIKLDVEKMIFLQWSDRVGLLNPELFDANFKDMKARETILRVLSSIKKLLSDAQVLQDQYGLQRFDLAIDSESGITPTELFNGVSETRLSRFLQEFGKLKRNIQHKQESSQPSRVHKVTKHVRWVVVHKDKFDHLINDLSYFNGALNALAPPVSASTFDLSSKDLSYVDNITHLDAIIQTSSERHSAISRAAITAKKLLLQNRILLRLWFPQHDDRKDNIQDARSKTLDWALTRLSAWLQNEAGIYWIFGKAGSGKSTLLKYLAGHEQTRIFLNQWASGSELILCQFFFYALGQTEQKSQLGLLRSLLYQILELWPEYAEAVLPNMWREILLIGESGEEVSQPQKHSIPSAFQLTKALSTLCKDHLREKKLCFFIDGLDEFEGQDMDVAAFIEKIGSFPNVKVIISSRPHPAFIAAFSTRPKMHLPDLTKSDILSYINDTVGSHPYLATLSELEPNIVVDIVRQLEDKASGVFLWVVLACRSVVQGCHNYDTIEDLKARVNALPGEVESLFEQMLTNIEPCWREDAVRILKMVHTNDRHPGSEPIPTVGLYLAQEQGLDVTSDLSRTVFAKRPTCRYDVMHNITEGRLRGRYCGLIEVSDDRSYIKFIHRSLHTFLSKPGVWERIFTSIEATEIDGHAMLSSLWLRLSASEALTSLIQRTFIENAMAHIYYGAKDRCAPEITLHNLSKLQFILGTPASGSLWTKARYCLLHVPRCRRYCDDVSLVLPLAVEMGLIQVVKYAVEQPTELRTLLIRAPYYQPSLLDCNDKGPHSTFTYLGSRCKSGGHFYTVQGRAGLFQTVYPLLYHAVCRPLLSELASRGCSIHEFTSRDPSSDMVQWLLSQGYSPNETFLRLKYSKHTTAWQEWIKETNENRIICYSMTQRTSQITMALIQAGAHIQVRESVTGSEFMARFDKYCQIPPDLTFNDNPSNRRLWLDVRRTIANRLYNNTGNQDNPKQEGRLRYYWTSPAVRTLQHVVLVIIFFYVMRYCI